MRFFSIALLLKNNNLIFKIKMRKINIICFLFLSSLFLFFGNSCKKKNKDNVDTGPAVTEVVKDIDGNVYHFVTIGSQVWMTENLKTSRYRNGDSITNAKAAYQWNTMTSGACCNNGNDVANAAVYGRLYNWYAIVDSRGLAPVGWHIPTDTEWATLATFLGGDALAGGKLKETGTIHWVAPNTGASNAYSFNALPTGIRLSNGTFEIPGSHSNFWTSTQVLPSNAWYRTLAFNQAALNRFNENKTSGFSIRLIKD